MPEFLTLQQIEHAYEAVSARISTQPEIGLILGSGLGDLADAVQDPVIIPTHHIPHYPVPTVKGHQGRLLFGTLQSKNVVVLQGRSHAYEGHNISQLSLPVRLMQWLGVKTLILTNAAGGINPTFSPGDLMLITDHIGFLTMAGANPLLGPNLDAFGPRFPDMSRAYDPELIAAAEEISRQHNLKVKKGIYVCLAGPNFETPAEIRFLKAIGADAVGMSTVPEVLTARHGGTRVLAISGITNQVAPDGTNLASHEEVLEAGTLIVPKLLTLIQHILPLL